MALLEELSVPDVETVIYDRPPLILALCQLRFTSVLGVADARVVAPFQRALQSSYPIATPVEQVEIELGVSDEGIAARKQQRSPQWRFTDEEENWSVVLTPDFVALETRAYETFGEFLLRLDEVFAALSRHIRPTVATRIGLRYINEIRLPEHNWPTAIRAELLGPLGAGAIRDHAVQSLQQLVMRFSAGEGIGIRHGLLENGTTVQPRGGQPPSDEPFYLLDFDAYKEFPGRRAFAIKSDEIRGLVESFNKAIYRLFRWSVTDDYLRALGVKDAGN